MSPHIDEVREEWQIHHLRTNILAHLTSAASAIADNHERQRHTEKLILPDLKIREKTKLSI
jgi:hypothetical protein